MKQTIEIEVPDGKEAIWKDGRVFFIDKKSELPKTWEEFCEKYPIDPKEVYLGPKGQITELLIVESCKRTPNSNKHLLATKGDAKAHLAIMQLHRLRDCYRQGWIPDWTSGGTHYCITKIKNTLEVGAYWHMNYFLSFPSKELAQQFLDNFRDLIEQAGDLI